MNTPERWLLQEKYGGQPSDAFYADCTRLRAGEPLAYLIGHTPFLDCTIDLSSRPLIPRPETEYWVEHCIRSIQSNPLPTRAVLDLCAGSGCIGIAIAKATPTARVTYAELEPTHLPTITANLRHNLPVPTYDAQNYTVVASDLFSAISGSFDLIVSNPPYIDPAVDRADRSVTDFEPHLALYGGHHGVAIIHRIIATAPSFLTPSGTLWLEHEPEQTETIHARAQAHGFHATTHTDQYAVSRYTILTMAQ